MWNLLAFAMCGLCFTGMARADTAAYQGERLAKYARYAGAPVPDFTMTSLWQWRVVGPQDIVAWPRIDSAYLITVAKPCMRLQRTNALGLTQETSMKVTQKYDKIIFGHQSCPITRIRPIDYKKLRSDDETVAADNAEK
ncbi:MAG: DUF6491 family protein [Rudaea sp.]